MFVSFLNACSEIQFGQEPTRQSTKKTFNPNLLNDKKENSIATQKFKATAILKSNISKTDIRPDSKDLNRQLFESINRWDLLQTRSLISRGVPVNQTDINNFTPLGSAVLQGNTKIVELLLEYGANLNRPIGRDNLAPIFIAAKNLDVHMMHYLWKQNADITQHEYIDGVEQNALSIFLVEVAKNSQKLNSEELVLLNEIIISTPKILITPQIFNKLSPRISKKLKEDFFRSMEQGNYSKVESYIKSGIDINDPWEGHTPLGYAIIKNKFNIVKLLLEEGCDANKRSGKHNAMLSFIAAQKGFIEILEMLRLAGVNLAHQEVVGDIESNILNFLFDHIKQTSRYFSSDELQLLRKIIKLNPELLENRQVPKVIEGIAYPITYVAINDRLPLEILQIMIDFVPLDFTSSDGKDLLYLFAEFVPENEPDQEELLKALLNRGFDPLKPYIITPGSPATDAFSCFLNHDKHDSLLTIMHFSDDLKKRVQEKYPDFDVDSRFMMEPNDFKLSS